MHILSEALKPQNPFLCPLTYPKIPSKLVEACQAGREQLRRQGPPEVFQTVEERLQVFKRSPKAFQDFKNSLQKPCNTQGKGQESPQKDLQSRDDIVIHVKQC